MISLEQLRVVTHSMGLAIHVHNDLVALGQLRFRLTEDNMVQISSVGELYRRLKHQSKEPGGGEGDLDGSLSRELEQ